MDDLKQYLATLPPNVYTRKQVVAMLAQRVHTLLQSRSSWLSFLLYRWDVSEEKLQYRLQAGNNSSPEAIIAELIYERWEQKMATREAHKNPTPPDVPGVDKW